MRIKLNLTQLTPDRIPGIYWLHVDITRILLIKQLKEKVQKVLKETRDIELCFDNVPFLDEDDITAINGNEEITVIVKERTNSEESNSFQTNTSIFYSNSIVSTENLEFQPIIYNESPSPSIVLNNNSKKRVRKRKNKKKKQSELVEPVNNDCIDNTVISIPSCDESEKTHKRFKLENEEELRLKDSSSSNESVHVIREIIRCNSPFPNLTKNNIILQPIAKKGKPLGSKVVQVPVFVRGHKCTPNDSTQNRSCTLNNINETIETTSSENYDMMVVDWSNMTRSKISNISELRVHDLIQFKILSMNENGEPGMSSSITARLELIHGFILHIQVLSGVNEFITNNSKFQIDIEDDYESHREVVYNDLYEIYKLL